MWLFSPQKVKDSSSHNLYPMSAFRFSCFADISMALVSETGLYMVGVVFLLLIMLSKDVERCTQAPTSLNSSWDIRRGHWMFLCKHYQNIIIPEQNRILHEYTNVENSPGAIKNVGEKKILSDSYTGLFPYFILQKKTFRCTILSCTEVAMLWA